MAYEHGTDKRGENRFLFKTDRKEMERRWKLTREAMRKEGIDCLVLSSDQRVFNGVLKYLTDFLCALYPVHALFTLDGFVMVGHEGFDNNTKTRGIVIPGSSLVHEEYHLADELQECVSAPAIQGLCFTDNYWPEGMAKVIKKYGYKKIGWVGMQYIPASIYKYFTENLTDCEFVNFTSQMDHIKAVKSDWEIQEFSKIVRIHDTLMEVAMQGIRVGRTERDIARDIRFAAEAMYCTESNVMTGAHESRPFNDYFLYSNKTIKNKDLFLLLIEMAGPAGMWGELGRTFYIGDDPSPEVRKIAEDQIALTKWVASVAKAGVNSADIHKELRAKEESMGYWPEDRIFAHSQGYDIVDRPCFNKDDDFILEKNMFVAIHPTLKNEKNIFYCCDNYVITEEGAKKLSRMPLDFFYIDTDGVNVIL